MKLLVGQFITIGLCVVLLGTAFIQQREISRLRQSVQSMQNEVNNNISHLESDIMAWQEGEKLIQDVQVRVLGTVPESRSLRTEVQMSLREWREDTKVWLIVDSPNTLPQRFPVNGFNGTYSHLVNLPAEEEISLRAQVETDGFTREESLKNIQSLSELLPIQMGGGGWAPDYSHGSLLIDDCTVFLHGLNGGAAEPVASIFCVSVNGEEILSVMARQTGEDVWSGPSEECPWEVPCQDGDEVELTLYCEDQLGLQYVFFIDSLRVGNSQMESLRPERSNLELIWPASA